MFRPSFESQFERSGYNIISYTMTFSVVKRRSALCILIEVRPLDKWPWKPTHQVELKVHQTNPDFPFFAHRAFRKHVNIKYYWLHDTFDRHRRFELLAPASVLFFGTSLCKRYQSNSNATLIWSKVFPMKAHRHTHPYKRWVARPNTVWSMSSTIFYLFHSPSRGSLLLAPQ